MSAVCPRAWSAPPRAAGVARSLVAACLVATGAIALGCSPTTAPLTVDVKTDVVPGIEFTGVRTEILDTTGGARAHAEIPAYRDEDWIHGRRAAELEGLERGTYVVRVALVRVDGTEVVSRRASVHVGGRTSVTMVITRDCPGVACATGQTCSGGRCVDELCTVEHPETCPAAECLVDGDCIAAASCAIGYCTTGACFFVPDRSVCSAVEYCDPDRGCTPLPDADAGAPPGGGHVAPTHVTDRALILAGTADVVVHADETWEFSGNGYVQAQVSGMNRTVRAATVGVEAGIYFGTLPQTGGGPVLTIFAVRSLHVEAGGSVYLRSTTASPSPFVLLASGDVVIDGTVDASALGLPFSDFEPTFAANPGVGGAAGAPFTTAPEPIGMGGSAGSGAGGGGGGHASTGGYGAIGPRGEPGGVGGSLAPDDAFLVGGAGGGASAIYMCPGACTAEGYGGGGGGALQLTSDVSITINPGGVIAANGAGGSRGSVYTGAGGGGGAGGTVVLESRSVTVRGAVVANGGGGGGGDASTTTDASTGATGRLDALRAAGGAGTGGTSTGGSGGAGGAGSVLQGDPAARGSDIGGGGGGAAGRLQFVTLPGGLTLGGVTSPSISPGRTQRTDLVLW